MANLIIKPTSGGSLILQDEGGTAAHTIDASGNSTLAGNATVSGNLAVSGRMPAGSTIKTTVYNIGKGTCSNAAFPKDNTIPQRTEGNEIFSQAYTPSTANCTLLIRAAVYLAESSNVADDMGCGLFISDQNDALQSNANILGSYNAPYGHAVGCRFLEHSMASWGTTAKTFSLRTHKCNSYNYPHCYGNNFAENLYGSSSTTKFVIQEIAT